MAATKRKQAPSKRAKRSLMAKRPSLSLPRLEPHHIDILGLAMIAVGIFLAGVAYLGWSGGTLGDGAIRAIRFVFGRLGDVVPAAMVVGGALVLLRELRPPGRPMRTGIIVLSAAIMLALAAGTLGLGPGRAPAALAWHPASFEARGGIIGQVEFWVSASLISSVGSEILAVFMLLAGAILISGATIANLMRATGAGVATTGRAVRRTTADIAQTAGVRRPATAAARAAAAARASRAASERAAEPGGGPEAEPEPLFPPEPDTSELVIRATHVEAPPIEGLADPPSSTSPRTIRSGAARSRPSPIGAPGRRRGSTTAPRKSTRRS